MNGLQSHIYLHTNLVISERQAGDRLKESQKSTSAGSDTSQNIKSSGGVTFATPPISEK